MADRVIIPLPGVGTLVLDGETYQAALAAGRALSGALSAPAAAPEPLLDADQAAAQLSVTARWLEDMARAAIIPHHKFGRWLRFRVSEVAAHCRVEGAPMPSPTDSQSVTAFRRQSRQ